MTRIRTTLGLLTLVTLPVVAGEQAPVDTHSAAAEELLDLLHLDTVMTQTMDAVLKAQVQSNPDLVKVEDILRSFLTKYVSYEAVKADLVRMYADAFTERELRELAAFYRTPTGQKSVALMPAMLEKGANLGVERVTRHMDELKAAIETRLKELEEQERQSDASEGD